MKTVELTFVLPPVYPPRWVTSVVKIEDYRLDARSKQGTVSKCGSGFQTLSNSSNQSFFDGSTFSPERSLQRYGRFTNKSPGGRSR